MRGHRGALELPFGGGCQADVELLTADINGPLRTRPGGLSHDVYDTTLVSDNVMTACLVLSYN